MRLKVAKNGKEYRCDQCHKLIGQKEVWPASLDGVKNSHHFCTRKHRELYIVTRYTVPFDSSRTQVTGSVIPVKNEEVNK